MADRSRLNNRLEGLLSEERAAEPENPRVTAPEPPVSRNVQLNIELPEEMRHALRMKALSKRTDTSKVLRELIQRWLDSEGLT